MNELPGLLFWPALVGYGEASLAYAGAGRRPGRLGAVATWGVRLGWLAQTSLLAAQAVRADGFPWVTWAGSLNLFVWMCVGGYLVWGCRKPFRTLGLVVMPLAAVLLAVSGAVGGVRGSAHAGAGDLFLALHIALVLAAFAGFTLAAGLAAVYLWQERRLKRREPELLRERAPSLAALDALAGRVVALAVPALTLGAAIGFVRLVREGDGLDATVAATVAAWIAYSGLVVSRERFGWRGRRAAYLALAAFALVLAVRVGVAPVGHFS